MGRVTGVGVSFTSTAGETLRELDVEVRQAIKGPYSSRSQIKVLQSERYGAGSVLTEEDIASEALFVGDILKGVRSTDGLRDYSSVFALGTPATYIKATGPSDERWAIRLVSPFAEKFGYEGSRANILRRLRDGKSVRPVDASPWGDLVSRATTPETRASEQLGSEELQEPSKKSGYEEAEEDLQDDKREDEEFGHEPDYGPAEGEQ